MKVFVTGGTGLVGSHVAERLRRRGDEVLCLQRSSSNTSFLRSIGCRIVRGDVRDDPESTVRAMEGCDALVHGAALIYARDPWPKIRAVNVEGTERILRSARKAGIGRAVHISSVAVYGDPRGRVDEETPLDSPLRPKDLYARSKREAEDVAFDLHGRGRLSVTVLRLSAVYGERDRLFAPRLAALARLPVTPLLGSGRAPLPVVYAGNAAEAVLGAMDASRGGGRAYNVASDHPTTQRELLEGIAGGLGCGLRLFPVPGPLVWWGARLGD
ncbi:MAG TPA: NAD(P)-dependent oxidoreductase, partial [Longimicrobiales bacterium]|nr:NAD(P)-dependent oxidoreductase [Longimicrobiales bacterium]